MSRGGEIGRLQSWVSEGRACGAQMAMEPARQALGAGDEALREALSWRERRRSGVLATVVEVGGEAPCPPGTKFAVDEVGRLAGILGSAALEGLVEAETESVLRAGAPRLVRFARIGGTEDWIPAAPADGSTDGEVKVFLEPVVQPPVIEIFGAGGVGTAVARLCEVLGRPYRIVDDRPDAVDPSRFPLALETKCAPWPDIVAGMEPGLATWGVVVTAGHAADAIVAAALLACPRVPYVGVMHNPRRALGLGRAIRALGSVPDRRFHCPIGISIARNAPGEIALAILAEIEMLQSGGRLVLGRLDWESSPDLVEDAP